MATFTVHVPPGAGNGATRADRTVFVQEGFCLAAFVFGPVFLLYKRLLLATCAWVVAAAALAFLSHALDLSAFPRALLFLVLAMLTGLEAGEARRRSLGRRGYIAAAVLAGVTREAGEKLFFGRSAASTGSDVPGVFAPRRVVPPGTGRPAVIGLFPMPGDGVPENRP
jgi:hypothetical protein